MVKLWPFGGDNNSAASFEKTLSALTQKIQKSSSKDAALRQRARKLKVSWTIYGGFTYILMTLIFVLVTGWQNWGAMEYSTVAGGPLILYGVRKLLTLWYDYRIKNTSDYLESLNKERDSTIEKLKLATKYNSTQQLIDKYSSKPSTPNKSPEDSKKKRQSTGPQQGPQGQRTFAQPPPTANIPRGPQGQLPPTANVPRGPPQQQGRPPSAGSSPPYQGPPSPVGAEFAPNAFSEPAPTAPASYGSPSWYDRILDALLGEDEMSAKNRFALICNQCKLVNGQAPPGARTLEDVGTWRCSACGAMNGVEKERPKVDVLRIGKDEETEKALRFIEDEELRQAMVEAGALEEEVEEDDGIVVAEPSSGDEGEENEEVEKSPAASTRSKKNRKKG